MTQGVPDNLAYHPDHPIGIMFSGGGARGAFQVGVWKILLEDKRGLGRAPSVISGTSAGALNGALIAAGLGPDEVLDFWLRLADKPPVRANQEFFRSVEKAFAQLVAREAFRGLTRRAREVRTAARLFTKHKWYRRSGFMAAVLEFLLTARFDNVSTLLDSIKPTYLFDTGPLREVLRKSIGSDVIPNTGIKLAINTVDIATGSVVRIVNSPPKKARRASIQHYQYEPRITLDMIIASASIPLLFNPVTVRGKELWDGGLLVNSPMAPAVALGASRLVPVLVTSQAAAPPQARLQTFGNAVERLADTFLENAYNVDRKLLLNSNMIARLMPSADYREVTLFKAIRPASSRLFNAGSYLFFERSVLLSMYHAGQIAAKKWLARGPEVDGRSSLAAPSDTQDTLE